jgi:hypothetical protein
MMFADARRVQARGPVVRGSRGQAAALTATLCASLIALLATGCTTLRDPAMPTVRIKAEKDLKCDGDFIEIESLWGGRYRAKGCGRVVEYDTVCDGLQCDVSRSGEEAPAWRGRADPGSINDRAR